MHRAEVQIQTPHLQQIQTPHRIYADVRKMHTETEDIRTRVKQLSVVLDSSLEFLTEKVKNINERINAIENTLNSKKALSKRKTKLPRAPL
tara:strand:- start:1875 stop:2147 length:273 start_codon:yes stop_codon:yes gene_type:complete